MEPIAKRNANASAYPHPVWLFLYENYEALEVYGLISTRLLRGGMTLEMADLKPNQITHRPKPFRLWWCGWRIPCRNPNGGVAQVLRRR